MLQFKIKIKGVKPLLWHAFTPSALSIETKPQSGKVGNNPSEWRDTVLVDPDNKLFIPAEYLFASLREGSKNVKVGRGTLKNKVISCLTVMDSIIYIKNRALPAEKDLGTNPLDPVFLDIRGVVNPSTKGRNVRYRIAASAGWEASFSVQWDDRVISVEQMQQIAECSGLYAGIGDGRAIGMGRFEILEFKKV